MNLIHIGLPKAASTTLQSAIFPAQRHFVYIGKSYGPDFDEQRQELVAQIRHQDSLEYDAAATAALLRTIRERVSAESRPLLLSHEVLSAEGRVDRRLVAERLHGLFAPAKILIVLRRQEAVLQSQYMNHRRLPGARVRSFERWLDEFYGSTRFPESLRVPLNHEPLVRAYDEVFGRNNVVVLPFELLGNRDLRFIQPLAELLRMQPMELIECLGRRVYNARQTHRLERINRLQSIFPKGTSFAALGRRYLSPSVYETVRRYVTGGRSLQPPELPERWAKHIHARFAHGNSLLELRTGLPLGALGYAVESAPLAAAS